MQQYYNCKKSVHNCQRRKKITQKRQKKRDGIKDVIVKKTCLQGYDFECSKTTY